MASKSSVESTVMVRGAPLVWSSSGNDRPKGSSSFKGSLNSGTISRAADAGSVPGRSEAASNPFDLGSLGVAAVRRFGVGPFVATSPTLPKSDPDQIKTPTIMRNATAGIAHIRWRSQAGWTGAEGAIQTKPSGLSDRSCIDPATVKRSRASCSGVW